MRVLNLQRTAYKLENLIDKNDTTVKQLSNYLGVSQTSVYNWLRADKMPSIDNLVSMTGFFHCKLDDIIAYQEVA